MSRDGIELSGDEVWMTFLVYPSGVRRAKGDLSLRSLKGEGG